MSMHGCANSDNQGTCWQQVSCTWHPECALAAYERSSVRVRFHAGTPIIKAPAENKNPGIPIVLWQLNFEVFVCMDDPRCMNTYNQGNRWESESWACRFESAWQLECGLVPNCRVCIVTYACSPLSVRFYYIRTVLRLLEIPPIRVRVCLARY